MPKSHHHRQFVQIQGPSHDAAEGGGDGSIQGEPPAAKRLRLDGADEGGLANAGAAAAGTEPRRAAGPLPPVACEIYLRSGDAVRALQLLPRYMFLERTVLGALADGLSPLDAIRKLPKNALGLYYHAAQSLLFNWALSRRVREHGRRVVVGDLVRVRAKKQPSERPQAEEEDGGEPSEESNDQGRGSLTGWWT